MSMYEVYSNLRSCIEDVEHGGGLDAHIALYILSNHEKIPSFSIGELAMACNTSAASISRFCRRVNNSNFRSLKEQIVEFNSWLDLEAADSKAHMSVDIPWFFDVVEGAICETKSLLTDDRLERAVDWLTHAQNVYVYGSSFSNLAARGLCEKLSRANRLCFSFDSVKGQMASLELLQRNDLVVFISFSGKTSHILDLYVRAKRQGCRILWISSNTTLDSKRNSELLLPVSKQTLHEYTTAPIESISLQCAVNALCISFTNRLRREDM